MKLIQISLSFAILTVFSTVLGANAETDNPAVVKQKQLIENSMDPLANPCDNFYQYACGEWDKMHQDKENYYSDTEDMLSYMMEQEAEFYYNSTQKFSNEPEFVKQSYKYYKSCFDLEEYEPAKYLQWLAANEHSALSTLLDTTTTKKEELAWIETLAIYRKYGLNDIFIKELIYTKTHDHMNTPIYLYRPDDFKSLKYSHFELVMESLNSELPHNETMQLWQEIRALEWKLNELDNIADEHRIKLEDLKEIGLEKYLRIMLNQTELDKNMKIHIQSVAYIKALFQLLDPYDTKFLNKYIEIRFLWYLHAHDSLSCSKSTNKIMDVATNWIFEQQHPIQKREISKIHDVFENIRKQFAKILKHNKNNFSSSSVEFLEAKLKNMKLKIGYFQDSDIMLALEKSYENVELSSNDYYGNQLRLLNFNFKTRHTSLKPSAVEVPIQDILLSFEGPDVFSLSYDYGFNIIRLPLWLVQEPLYHSNTTDLYKYSTLGFILARTLFFAFSDQGLKFDYQGNYNDPNHDEIFGSFKFYYNHNCLGDLVASDSDLKIRQINSLRLIYQQFFDNYPVDSIGDRHSFFLNFAQVFCTTVPSDADRHNLNDALAQFEEFSTVFQCSADSQMNAEEKCVIWG